MEYPDKFTILLELLVTKGVLTDEEFAVYYKTRTKELNKEIRRQYKNFYKVKTSS